MRGLVLCLALVVAAPSPVRAQTETADLLRQAQELYERLEIERALPLLRQIVSPSWPHEVTKEQRVQAFTYLGASLALTDRKSTRLNSSHGYISYAVFCLKKKKKQQHTEM